MQYQKLKIPKRFTNINYETDVPVHIKEKAEKVMISRNGLYIYGRSGIGKTHILFAIAKMFEEKKYRVIFLNTSVFLKELRDEIGKNNTYTSSLCDYLINFNGIIFFDDIGTEKATEWAREIFYSIFNNRYENMFPVFFTSNYSLNELADKIGDKICSRIMGMCEMVELSGKDRRANANK